MIKIARKLRPFSHRSGAKCLIPGTETIVEAYPNLLRVGSIETALNIVSGFTLQQDLERNCVWVFGKNFRMKIKGPHFQNIEKLSLGSHKSQNWDKVVTLADILPVIFDLGQKSKPGVPVQISNYEEFYRTSFDGIAVPNRPFLREAYQKIRSHFINENGSELILLPDNPFPHGRLLNLQTQFGTLDMEWTKRRLRRAIFHPKITGEIIFPYRFRKKMQQHEKGIMMNGVLPIEAGKTMFLDRFF